MSRAGRKISALCPRVHKYASCEEWSHSAGDGNILLLWNKSVFMKHGNFIAEKLKSFVEEWKGVVEED
jgi:hypothetical protein